MQILYTVNNCVIQAIIVFKLKTMQPVKQYNILQNTKK